MREPFFIKAKQLLPVLFLLSSIFPVGGQPLPLMEELNRGDPIFAQHIEGIELTADEVIPLQIVRYMTRRGDTFYSLIARLELHAATLASINRLSRPELEEGVTILVPNRNGLFIPQSVPDTLVLERLYEKHPQTDAIPVRIASSETHWNEFTFLEGERFSDSERLVFNRSFLINPLPGSDVSSPFGNRIHPLTGEHSFHEGIDLAAPFGSPVHAAAEGEVERIDRDRILGLSIYIVHDGSFRTRYAHLRETFVNVGDAVAKGMVIAEVGSTGYSTGPHLHFEVTMDDIPQDPLQFISVD